MNIIAGKMKDNELEEKICEMAGFCGCGNPSSSIKLLYEVLKIIELKTIIKPQWDESIIKLEEILDYKNRPEIFYTYLYWLDHLSLTEHGCSITGCWLTSNGYELLKLMDKYYE